MHKNMTSDSLRALLYDDVNVEKLEHNKFMLKFEKDINGNKKPYKSLLKGSDFHCINKFALEKLVNG